MGEIAICETCFYESHSNSITWQSNIMYKYNFMLFCPTQGNFVCDSNCDMCFCLYVCHLLNIFQQLCD